MKRKISVSFFCFDLVGSALCIFGILQITEIITLYGIPRCIQHAYDLLTTLLDLGGHFSLVLGSPQHIFVDPRIILEAYEATAFTEGIVADGITGIVLQIAKVCDGGKHIHGGGHLLHGLRLQLVAVNKEGSVASFCNTPFCNIFIYGHPGRRVPMCQDRSENRSLHLHNK